MKLKSYFIAAIELDNVKGSVLIEKLKICPYIAQEVILETIGKNHEDHVTADLKVKIKTCSQDKIFLIGNRISIPYYGKRLIYKIIEVSSDKMLENEFKNLSLTEKTKEKMLYIFLYSTKFVILQNEKQTKSIKKQRQYTLEDIGGYSELINKLRNVFNIGLGKYGNADKFFCSKCILLHGHPGVGKTIISEALLAELNAHIQAIDILNIHPKNSKESDVELHNLFQKAFARAPSVIFIDDIDKLFVKKSYSENDKKVLTSLEALIDSLNSCENVMLLATTSKPDSIESSLMQSGRIDQEFEVSVPTKEVRKEIISKILLKMQHNLTPEDVDQIAYETHGFVGRDLLRLCSQAGSIAIEKKIVNFSFQNLKEVIVSKEDIKAAMNIVNPSAMKEVLVDIPNVKWADIGGQKEAKLNLQQNVEWPLKHPEAFSRIGIKPLKGVLMYGPPGCSKTMIAKALATESKLNFLSIKVSTRTFKIRLKFNTDILF